MFPVGQFFCFSVHAQQLEQEQADARAQRDAGGEQSLVKALNPDAVGDRLVIINGDNPPEMLVRYGLSSAGDRLHGGQCKRAVVAGEAHLIMIDIAA